MTSPQPLLPDHPGTVRFVLDGQVRVVQVVDPTRTVLQWLRETEFRTGTKEGCAEGDCGACTVVLGELVEGAVRYRAVNACIQFLPTLDGKALFTVESLRDPTSGRLHPVQQAMVDTHASQCGFCTPGFVMSLFALHRNNPAPDRRAVTDALAGNLCRCTGYRPIIEAALQLHQREPVSTQGVGPGTEGHDDARLAAQLGGLQRHASLRVGTAPRRFIAPASLAEVGEVLTRHPNARVLAGGTDVGLWVTKQLRDLGDIVYLGNVAELKQIATTDAHITIGAAVPLSDAFDALVVHYPQLRDFFRRFASPPIRNAGTLGGNIANGSPIGDSMPILIALGTRVAMLRGTMRRELPLEALYLGYQKTGLHAGEIIERIVVPTPVPDTLIGAYKISKRFDQDISAVCAGFALSIEDGRIDMARVAFGGMAVTPKRASACEAALRDSAWNEATCARAMQALDRDFSPITDMRASGEYRRTVARNLLRKFLLESTRALGDAPGDLYGLEPSGYGLSEEGAA